MDGDDIYWTEIRPSEGGRYVIVRRTPDGELTDINPEPYSARTRIHEYGGGSCAVSNGTVYYSNFADQRLYRQEPGGQPEALSPPGDLYYADGIIDRQHKRMICILEDHTIKEKEAVNSLVSLDLETGKVIEVMASGNDFYASPRISADGKRIAWLTWNHPNMPWDGTELWVADLSADGSIKNAELAAGGSEESILQPEWSAQGVLHFISDRTGWWNLYRWEQGISESLAPIDAEIGQPMWRLGRSTYGFVSPNKIICAYTKNGFWYLGSINTLTGQLERIETPYTYILHLHALPGKVVFLGGSPTKMSALALLDLETGAIDEICTLGESEIDSPFLSNPEAVEFPTETGRAAYGLYYQPRNPDFSGPEGERPPLLVMSHSGPTWAAKTDLRMKIQFWTSRGIAVLDVNYGGSTGYGRPYRQRLYGLWGVVDVDDCVNGARYLVERGDVDGDKLAITGGSAGGYTTLCALTFRDTFNAGSSHYGISDLEPLTAHSHKFESRYMDNLVGPYPESKSLYEQRSPIHFADQISCPVIFFQGLEDNVVPAEQSEMMVEKLREKGLPVAYIPFEDEGHSFRKAENIARALDAEYYFYSRVFGFELAEPVEPVKIENLLS